MHFFSRLWRRLRADRPAKRRGVAADTAPVDPHPLAVAAQGEPSTERFLIMRNAVLSRDMAVIGYDFSQTGDRASSAVELEREKALLRHARSAEAQELVGDRIAFVSISHPLLLDPVIDDLARTRTTLLVRPTSLHGISAPHIERISALRQAGLPIGLADGRAALEVEALAAAISVAFFSITEFLPPDLLRISRQLSKLHPKLRLGVRGIQSQEEFDACGRLDFVYFQGPFIRRREDWSQNRANPSALRICDLLEAVRKGAELHEIAEKIRLDPMLSYRILRVANSAAVGAMRNITSIADATMILGREPLYRWLVLLLCVTAPPSPGHAALLENALARARLMELLAGSGATPSLRQAMFLTGLFSLLDVMLKVSMDSLLAQLQLPPDVGSAIRDRTGPCARVLQLAEACERTDVSLVIELCGSLGIDLGTFNLTLASAGAWARQTTREIQP